MNAKDMQKFCGTEERVAEIRHPFTRGDFTYATNGHIMIRVPRLAEDCDQPRAPHAEKLFDMAPAMELAPLPAMELPEPATEECPVCTEGENIHDCPNCTCSCETCDDKGEIQVQVSCDLNGAIYQTKYIRLIQTLPGVLFATNAPQSGSARFAFDGGEGLLNSCRARMEHHWMPDGTIIDTNTDEEI